MVCRKGEGGKREVGLGVVLPSLFPEQGYDQSTLKRDFFFSSLSFIILCYSGFVSSEMPA